MVTHYLVKWRSLPYEDATWELEEDVDDESIRKFNQLQLLPPEDELEVGVVRGCGLSHVTPIFVYMCSSILGHHLMLSSH